MRLVVPALLAALLCSCVALRDDMRRAEASFDDARYEDTETWLTDLEQKLPRMDREMRARFYYLRGITAYRLGDQPRARHYLALARVESSPGGAGLREGWPTTLRTTLEELGVPPLPNEPREEASEAEAPEPTSEVQGIEPTSPSAPEEPAPEAIPLPPKE